MYINLTFIELHAYLDRHIGFDLYTIHDNNYNNYHIVLLNFHSIISVKRRIKNNGKVTITDEAK